MQVSKEELVFDKLIISKQLLTKTGYTEQQIKMQYLKYGNLFFQILGKQFYQKFSLQFGHIIKNYLKKKQQQNLNIQISLHQSKQQKITNKDNEINDELDQKQFFIQFDDFIYRKNKTQNNQSYQEKLKSKILFYKPHQKISVFQFDLIDEQNVIQTIVIDQNNKIKQKVQNDSLQKQHNVLERLIVQFSQHQLQDTEIEI